MLVDKIAKAGNVILVSKITSMKKITIARNSGGDVIILEITPKSSTEIPITSEETKYLKRVL